VLLVLLLLLLRVVGIMVMCSRRQVVLQQMRLHLRQSRGARHEAQVQHLTLGGTQYSSGEAAELYSKVLEMAGLKAEGVAAVEGGDSGATTGGVETSAAPAVGAADGDVQQASSGTAAVPLAEQGGKQ
jgi:hypothetical protein